MVTTLVMVGYLVGALVTIRLAYIRFNNDYRRSGSHWDSWDEFEKRGYAVIAGILWPGFWLYLGTAWLRNR